MAQSRNATSNGKAPGSITLDVGLLAWFIKTLSTANLLCLKKLVEEEADRRLEEKAR